MRIDGAKLPAQLRTRIGEASSGPEVSPDFFVHRTESEGGKVAAILVGAVGVGLVAFAAVNRWAPLSGRYWRTPEIVVGLVAAFLAALFVISNAIRIRALKRSEVKPAIVLSPVLIAKTGLDAELIELHYLRDLTQPSFTHHHTNGSYTHTAIRLRFEGGTLSFDIRARKKADAFLAFMKSTPEKLKRWVEDGSIARKADELDWIQAFALQAAKKKADPRRDEGDEEAPRVRARSRLAQETGGSAAAPVPAWEQHLLTQKGQLVAALAISALVTTTSYGANLFVSDEAEWSHAVRMKQPAEYRAYVANAPLRRHAAEAEIAADDRTYELAVEKKAASPLRAYRKEYPNGRHASEAKDSIQALYRAAEEQYVAKTAKADEQAASGMKALFAYMREQDAPLVKICFLPGEGIDGKTLETATRRATGSSRVHGVSGSFNEDANKGREDRIVAVMVASFKKVLPEELFDLKKANADEDGPRFLVRYSVHGTGSYYMTDSENMLPLEQKQVWVGIAIGFDFSLQVPGSKYPPSPKPEDGFRFEMTARPAPNFDVRENASPNEVYDRMVATAFDQFEVNLANAYGLELTMPANWGQLEGLQHRPTIPQFPDVNALGAKDPTNPFAALGGAPTTTPLEDLALAVLNVPGADMKPTNQLVPLLAKRAKAKGLKATKEEMTSAIDTARLRKALRGLDNPNGSGK